MFCARTDAERVRDPCSELGTHTEALCRNWVNTGPDAFTVLKTGVRKDSWVRIPCIDGVFCEDPLSSVQFHQATYLTVSDRDQLQHTVRHRVLRYVHRWKSLVSSLATEA